MSIIERGEAGLSPGLRDSYFQCRYTILFYSLVFTLVAGPLATAVGLDGRLIDVALGFNLIAATLPISSHRNRQMLLIAVVSVVLLTGLITLSLDAGSLPALSLTFWSVVALLAAASALVFALRATAIDREHVYAALSAYLLAGLFCGVLYWVLAQVDSAAFSDDLSRVSAIYFSFVTLATLGYGDIVPRNELGRGLAIFEGVGGQLFLAVFVARLVSLFRREA